MASVEVRAEQIRTLYRNGPAVLVANLINAWIVTGVLWGAAAPEACSLGMR